jgi:diaminopimelate decarboxylase
VNHFDYKNGELHCEDVALSQVARDIGTPFYVYSSATLTRHYKVFDDALSSVPHIICYSVKACSNLAVLRLLANLGSSFDIVSGGELFRLQKAGVALDKVVYSGVGKTRDEMKMALDAGILSFNVESVPELLLLNEVATACGTCAPVSMRVNPDVDAATHPYISTGLHQNKFGIPWDRALEAYDKAALLEGIKVVGLDCHIGSQLTSLDPLLEAVDRMLSLVTELRNRGHQIHHLDLGGGLGITYSDEVPPHPREMAKAVIERTQGYDLTLVFEPGRVIVGNAGVLVTRVLYNKNTNTKRFVIVDAAMNDAIRPSLYGAHHSIEPVVQSKGDKMVTADVVGPVCESGDFFARDREIAQVEAGDLLVLNSSGAYGFSMSSNYNSRTRVPEVLVQGGQYHVIRSRETLQDLVHGEQIPPHLLGL